MKLRVYYSVSGGIKMTNFSSIMCPKFCLSDFSNFAQIAYIHEAKKYLVLDFMQMLQVILYHWVVMTTFYYNSVNHQSGLPKNTFSKLSYIFLIHESVPQIMSFNLRYMTVS